MFKLNIECSKDINELHINFSDGSSIITTNTDNRSDKNGEKNKKQEKSEIQERKPSKSDFDESIKESKPKKEMFLDTDVDFGTIEQDIVEKPTIDDYDRPVKVAHELQNFSF